MRHTALTLEYMHSEKANALVVEELRRKVPQRMHRDVKLASILLDATLSIAKLGDLGLVKAEDTSSNTFLIGTPGYQVPEARYERIVLN